MYFALYALLTAAGTAMAWRSNPLYSLGRTARFLILVALALGVFIGAEVGVIAIGDRTGPLVEGYLLGITIVLGAMMLIWVVISASTPRVHALPAGVPLVRYHRERVVPWIWRVLAFAVVYLAVSASLRGDAAEAVQLLGAMAVGLALVLVFTMHVAARGMDRSLTSVEAAPWIHWRYPVDAWSTWRSALVARASRPSHRTWNARRDWRRLLAPFAIVTILWAGLAAAAVPPLFILAELGGIAVFMIVLLEVLARIAVGAPERLRRLLLRAPAETYAGDAGIFTDGVFTQWQTASSWLVSASIDAGTPRSIALEFARITAGAVTAQSFTQRVLIPPDADDDLRALQAHLTTRCPDASVTLVAESAAKR